MSSTALKVLLVDDNVMNQSVAMALLEPRGFDIDVVADGAAAVEAVEATRYDVVLMDCQMPILDGYEATRQIRGLESSARAVPIVAMTANAMQGDREKCLAAGMNDYLSKPLDAARMFAVIDQWTIGLDRDEPDAVEPTSPRTSVPGPAPGPAPG